MTAEIKGKNLIITIPLEEDPKPSTSGKTRVVASSRGNVKTALQYKGQPVTVGFNAYIPNQ